MKWVTWRQHRLETIISLVVLAALAVLFIPFGLARLSLFHSLGLANLIPNTANYVTLSSEFLTKYPLLSALASAVTFLPGIIGALFSYPLVREFEQRTYRLAWTQSVTRGRWLLAKLGFALAATVISTVLLSLLMSWFLAPTDQLTGPFNNFSLQGIVPVAYAVFTFAVAVAVGTFSRRTALAVLTAFVVVIAAVTIVSNGPRPHYMDPLQQTTPVSYSSQGIPQIMRSPEDTPIPDTAWTIDQYFVDASGQRLDNISLQDGHINKEYGSKSSASEIAGLVVEYQPASRYWPFQGIEAAIFLAMSAVLLGATIRVVKWRMR